VNDLQAVAGGIVLPKSVLAIDLRALSHRCDQRVDGILGVDFFRGRIVQIDFTRAESEYWKSAIQSQPVKSSVHKFLTCMNSHC
jgi:hypothetical protein